MDRFSIRMLAAVVIVAGCAPAAAGPALPRPAQAAPLVSTSAPDVTTTSISEAAMMTSSCPGDLCLIYHIDPDARWSNGKSVSVNDFVETLSVMAASGDSASIYRDVKSLDPIDQTTFRVVLDDEVGSWPLLFERVLPDDVGSGITAETPVTGPYRISEWIPGDRLTLVRSDDWWSETDPISGAEPGSVAEITFLFMDSDDVVTALEEATIDVYSTRATPELLETLSGIKGYRQTLSPGPFWEHIDFHHDDPMLSQPWVREVFDLAIDRQKALDLTVRRIDPAAQPLDNTVWMLETVNYEAHHTDRHDPVAAEQLLASHGCERNNNVYTCADREMTFRWVSTNDDPARVDLFESVRDDLEVVGIELIGEFLTPSAFVTRDFLFADPDEWQLVNFSWKAGVDPSSTDPMYFCQDSDFNVNRYCSPDVENLVRAAAQESDTSARASLYNEADRLYLEDRAVIPLYQKPNLLITRTGLDGPTPNWTPQSDLWNVVTWTGKDSIVVALDSAPVTLDPTVTGDTGTDMILSALLYGASGMDPAQQRHPVLISSVDVIEG